MLHDVHLAAAAVEADPIASMRRRIAALKLDLTGMVVVTEAATGAYACTAPIAAMAGAAKVYALARDTARHGSAAEARAATLALAEWAGVADAVSFIDRLDADVLGRCDIITNSGHLRPIDARVVAALPPRAVVALMFEAWEFRGADLDLAACRRRGVRVAAVNERHADVAVFPFLGPLCARLLEDGGVELGDRDVGLICDNPFAPFVAAGLRQAGAVVQLFAGADDVTEGGWDAIVLSGGPSMDRLEKADLRVLKRKAGTAVIAQFWGEIDRRAALEAGFRVLPEAEPRRGHMGILLNALGDEPIIRLQAGGLRAAEIVARGGEPAPGGVAELV